MITGNESAYPNSIVLSEQDFSCVDGMTIRQHFASLAMQGLCAREVNGVFRDPQMIARESIQVADALIKELNSQP